ncbi:DUF1996 domain-containing protein [Actinomycetospora soli]|uniref:DUF1996 domain-containing protein n=1 Tax=Actinomycetospora soli TaxID=2893887 RepID=UPI001E288BA0|nr:DUF1996 domain-containing protein [Actinomycetospora soli]MCD2191315.1 DUF1996 domain-containing protein [Actinomycetospora soli]
MSAGRRGPDRVLPRRARLALVVVAALLVAVGVPVAGLAVLAHTTGPGSTTSAAAVALAAGDDESKDKDKDKDGSGDSGSGDSKDDSSSKSKDDQSKDAGGDGSKDSGDGAGSGDNSEGGDKGGEGGGEFPGRDKAGRAGADEYTDVSQVASNQQVGQGGQFSGGSYSFSCPLSDHHNSDNFIIAPGKRNGAQHTHDYAGNNSTNAASGTDQSTLEESSTTCTNGDKSPIFWPVMRDLAGVGPDVGQDGGSLDGNVGSFIEPTAVDYTLHGHGTRAVSPMPLNITLVTGSAKAASTGKGSNAKFACASSPDRVSDKYIACPAGDQMQRVYDFPSCWNGKDLDSKTHTDHLTYPDQDGECPTDKTPVPALRITVGYQDLPGRSYAIDSFPEQQHNPVTDHALLEYLSSESRAQAGANCINAAKSCSQDSGQDTSRAGRLGFSDEVPQAKNYDAAMADMGFWGQTPTDPPTGSAGVAGMAGMGH